MGEGGQALHSTMVRQMIMLVKVVIILSAGGQGGHGGQGRGHVGGGQDGGHGGGPGGGQDGGHGGQSCDHAVGPGGGQGRDHAGELSIGSQVKRKKNEPDKDAPSSLYILSATNPIRFMVALPKQC